MKKIIPILIVLSLLLPILPAQADTGGAVFDPTTLFVPDIVDVQFESEANVTDTISATALPEVMPFWADLVNVENVDNDGEGVYIAVLDTGLLEDWPFFFSQANIADNLGIGFTHEVWWDYDLDELMFGDLRDDRGFITEWASGHGTHVTSTITGFNINNDFWVKGIAPQATIIPVLVLDGWVVETPEGFIGLEGGTDEMVAAGIVYVADLADTLDGPVIINMSLGGPTRSAMIEAAVDYAISKGVIVVASAGNSGADGMGYPGGLRQIISAGAGGWADMFNHGWRADVPERLNSRDSMGNNWQIYLEDFSSRPNKDLDQKYQDLDVTAPGAAIVGPYSPAFDPGVGYFYLWGTSMSAPHVSAIAGLVLQSYPWVQQAQMESLLRLGARDTPLPANDSIVAFPLFLEPPYYYICSWSGGDYGTGFLLADNVLQVAMRRVR